MASTYTPLGVEKMANTKLSLVQDYLAKASDVSIEVNQGAFTFPAFYAVMASAYMEKYKMTREHLMKVSIKNHHNASMNPRAQINLSIKQIMQNRKSKLDKSGKSVFKQLVFELESSDIIIISCNDWEEKLRNKNNWSEGLSVVIEKKEISDWFYNRK